MATSGAARRRRKAGLLAKTREEIEEEKKEAKEKEKNLERRIDELAREKGKQKGGQEKKRKLAGLAEMMGVDGELEEPQIGRDGDWAQAVRASIGIFLYKARVVLVE